jgi:hypothetical protein
MDMLISISMRKKCSNYLKKSIKIKLVHLYNKLENKNLYKNYQAILNIQTRFIHRVI